MKLVIINGTNRKGSTYNLTHMIVEKIKKNVELETVEFFLPKDMPHPCIGCFNCILKDESLCPHIDSTSPIINAMLEADFIIITSPVYVFDVSGQLKSFLDHLGYIWMSHRPNATMFNKIGLSVVTAAGAGLKHTSKTIENSFNWWGVKRYFNFSKLVMASSYKEISKDRLKQLDKDANNLAKKISKALIKKDKLNARFKTRFFFSLFRSLKKSHPEWNEIDTKYWYEEGYMKGMKPWIITKN